MCDCLCAHDVYLAVQQRRREEFEELDVALLDGAEHCVYLLPGRVAAEHSLQPPSNTIRAFDLAACGLVDDEGLALLVIML